MNEINYVKLGHCGNGNYTRRNLLLCFFFFFLRYENRALVEIQRERERERERAVSGLVAGGARVA